MKVFNKRNLRKFFGWLVFLLLILFFINLKLVFYGIGQLRGQLHVLNNAHPIEHYLSAPEYPDSLKQKVRLVQQIRQFAIDSLGITNTASYKDIYNQEGKTILWNVTACKKYKLDAYKWGFPVLGEVSYKGFFNFHKAKKLRDQLREEGYDASVREVSAWSTLGYFDDPILSNNLFLEEGQLANLIIHEMTHGTVFVPGDIDYNENLASFVGDLGARKFLAYYYGDSSEAYRNYQYQFEDYNIYTAHILKGATQLDSLYRTLSTQPDSQKQYLKARLIEKIFNNVKQLPLHRPDKFVYPAWKSLPDNTYFMRYVRYRSLLGEFEKEFATKFNSNFKLYLDHLKQKYGTL